MSEYVLLGLRVLLGAAFLAAGGAKLAGAKPLVQVFARIGVGQWFRYLTGGIEVAGAVMLFVPGFTPAGAGLLLATMVGATVAHLAVLGDKPVAPVVLGVLLGAVLYLSLTGLSAPVTS